MQYYSYRHSTIHTTAYGNKHNYGCVSSGRVHSSKCSSSPHSDVVREVDVTGALKPSIVVQRAAAPKNGVEFHQRPIDDIRYSLATLYDVWWRRPKIKTH